MPVLAETRIVQNKPPVCISPLKYPLSKTGAQKRKKKNKKFKYCKQYVSTSSFIKLESDSNGKYTFLNPNKDGYEGNFCAESSESNACIKNLYRPARMSSMSESASTPRLPKLTAKCSTPTPSMSSQSSRTCTPRSSLGCRLPVTLPANSLPGAHERRKKLPILAAIKPENEKAERERFLRANYNYNPLFIYKFPADADILERLGKPSDKYLNIVSIHVLVSSLKRTLFLITAPKTRSVGWMFLLCS